MAVGALVLHSVLLTTRRAQAASEEMLCHDTGIHLRSMHSPQAGRTSDVLQSICFSDSLRQPKLEWPAYSEAPDSGTSAKYAKLAKALC